MFPRTFSQIGSLVTCLEEAFNPSTLENDLVSLFFSNKNLYPKDDMIERFRYLNHKLKLENFKSREFPKIMKDFSL